MKPSTISQIQKELTVLEPRQLMDICLRLAKYKNENKELLSYLLFEGQDEKKFIANVKAEIDSQFTSMNVNTMYFIRKSVRKILRFTNKYIKYSGNYETELELRIYFCTRFKASAIPINKSETLVNLYQNQLKKINTVLSKLHEDIRIDYNNELERLAL